MERDGDQQAGAVALDTLNIRIQLLQDTFQRLRRRSRLLTLGATAGAFSLVIAAAIWYLAPPSLRTPVAMPLLLLAAGIISSVYVIRRRPPLSGREAEFLGVPPDEIRTFSRQDFELLSLRTRALRREHPQSGVEDQRLGYQDDISFYVDELRARGVRSRRANNIVQIITIVGSLAATGIGGIAIAQQAIQWISPALTFIVGTASGVAAIYKFKDRSFYSQQTANAIDQEINAFNLGIGRYVVNDLQSKGEARTILVEEIHRLRTEQENREQNLDQPPQRSTTSEQ